MGSLYFKNKLKLYKKCSEKLYRLNFDLFTFLYTL